MPSRYMDGEEVMTPKSYSARSKIATTCVGKLKIDMPCLIDDMDNGVDKKYDGFPDRLYVVDTDGTIAVRAERGPWGFKAGVEGITNWLAERFPTIAAGSSNEPGSAGTD